MRGAIPVTNKLVPGFSVASGLAEVRFVAYKRITLSYLGSRLSRSGIRSSSSRRAGLALRLGAGERLRSRLSSYALSRSILTVTTAGAERRVETSLVCVDEPPLSSSRGAPKLGPCVCQIKLALARSPHASQITCAVCMLVEEVVNKPASRVLNRAQQKAGYAILDSASRLRQQIRHLDELQRDNYNDVKIEIPKESAKKNKQSLGVRKILTSRKTLQNYIDETETTLRRQASIPESGYPRRQFCSVCGYWGSYRCLKCGLSNCSQLCADAHKETRCQR